MSETNPAEEATSPGRRKIVKKIAPPPTPPIREQDSADMFDPIATPPVAVDKKERTPSPFQMHGGGQNSSSKIVTSTKKPAVVEGEVETGDVVHCTHGRGMVVDVRSDGILVIEAMDWQLANKCTPTFYIMKDTPPHTPGVRLVQKGFNRSRKNSASIMPHSNILPSRSPPGTKEPETPSSSLDCFAAVLDCVIS